MTGHSGPGIALAIFRPMHRWWTWLQPGQLRRLHQKLCVVDGEVAFVGGIILAYGARLAGGCTSGHGISGALQLSVSSWVALTSFFIGAVATAHLLFRL
jgi:uncharacterized membrane protein YedE/YeeE